jgi:hypothetical protein
MIICTTKKEKEGRFFPRRLTISSNLDFTQVNAWDFGLRLSTKDKEKEWAVWKAGLRAVVRAVVFTEEFFVLYCSPYSKSLTEPVFSWWATPILLTIKNSLTSFRFVSWQTVLRSLLSIYVID